ncbi:MAG TPA: hypothetical protein VG871_03535 [Vicinamibacterales bacterium]|nr:hypothetical protein [Vicinamibacterales bacterium]
MFTTVRRTGYATALVALAALVLGAIVLPARTAATVLPLTWAIAGGVLVTQAILRWRKTRTPPERDTVASIDVRQPRIAGQYASLHAYLEHRFASNVVLTFEQIESLLGFALPQPASTEPGWWTAAGAGDADRHAEAWIRAGRSATPNLAARTIAFERVA